MSDSPEGRSGSSPGAYAIVHSDEPQVFLAEDEWVISRVLALQLVALTPSAEISSPSRLQAIREALLQERWDVALAEWIEETGSVVDVFPYAPKVWTASELEEVRASMEICVAPTFEEPS